MITLALALIMWLYGPQSPMALYLLFPIITLLVSASTNLSTRAPLTSPVVSLIVLLSKSKKIIQTAQEQKEEVSFTYEEEKK